MGVNRISTEETSLYVLPSGDGTRQLSIDLANIIRQEVRLGEVATVNTETAAELLSTYNEVWLKLNRSVTALTLEKNKAENHYKRSKAVAKLNCTDEAVKAKGHSKASADLREAMVELDADVINSKDRYDHISAVLLVLQGKQEAFYNAYNSVKKLTSFGSLPPAKYNDGNRPKPYKQDPPNQEDDLPDGFGVAR